MKQIADRMTTYTAPEWNSRAHQQSSSEDWRSLRLPNIGSLSQ
ncbi:MAG: hypothetical protein AAFQ89_05360 [Cyanobacteria bacterium J06626_18]